MSDLREQIEAIKRNAVDCIDRGNEPYINGARLILLLDGVLTRIERLEAPGAPGAGVRAAAGARPPEGGATDALLDFCENAGRWCESAVVNGSAWHLTVEEANRFEALRDALRASVGAAAAPDKLAWLIEDTRVPPEHGPLYYAGVEWSVDHLKAVRYARRDDAERAIMGLPNGWHLIGKAVGHMWVGATRQREQEEG